MSNIIRKRFVCIIAAPASTFNHYQQRHRTNEQLKREKRTQKKHWFCFVVCFTGSIWGSNQQPFHCLLDTGQSWQRHDVSVARYLFEPSVFCLWCADYVTVTDISHHDVKKRWRLKKSTLKKGEGKHIQLSRKICVNGLCFSFAGWKGATENQKETGEWGWGGESDVSAHSSPSACNQYQQYVTLTKYWGERKTGVDENDGKAYW